jgi:hypothetical protein
MFDKGALFDLSSSFARTSSIFGSNLSLIMYQFVQSDSRFFRFLGIFEWQT